MVIFGRKSKYFSFFNIIVMKSYRLKTTIFSLIYALIPLSASNIILSDTTAIKSGDLKNNPQTSNSINHSTVAPDDTIVPLTIHDADDFIELSSDDFGEEVNADFDETSDVFSNDITTNYDIPSDDIYNHLWSDKSINPYNIKYSDLPDSLQVDCRGFVFPITKKRATPITSNFGPRWRRFHYGTDIGLQIGDSVVAAFSGTVRLVHYERRGYGNYIIIRHKNGLESLYAHLDKVLVVPNEVVEAGELIAFGGNTGRSTGPHLHFEFRFLGIPFNTNKIIDYKEEACYNDFYCLIKNETFKYKTKASRYKKRAYHRVRKGDTLSRIARRYGTTISKLARLNGIKRTSTLRVGRLLRYR